MKGALKTVLLVALSVASLTCAADELLRPAQVPVPASYFGMHFHRAAESTSVPKDGIGSWRLWDARVAWRYLANNGPSIDFRPLDRLVSLARERRIDLLYTLGATPSWASARPDEKGPYGPGSAAEPRDVTDLNDFIRRVAHRYKGQIRSYEIWNEPNYAFFTGSVQSLVDISCSVAAVLKEVDPQITVVSPSAVAGYPQFKWLEEFLARDGARCVDVIGYHIYAPKGTPESMLPTLRGVQNMLAKYHVADKPLWNTETGWRLDVGPNSAAAAIDPTWPKLDAVLSPAYVARALLIGWAGGLQRYYWYSWDNYDMGFLRVDGHPSPSATAYQTMESWMRGAVVRECSSTGLLWQCTLVRDARTNFILWTEDVATHVIPVPVGMSNAQTLAGESRDLLIGTTMEIGPSPLLLGP